MGPFTNKAQAKRWLLRELGISQGTFAIIWTKLIDSEHVRAALEDEDGPQELLREAKKLEEVIVRGRAVDRRRGRPKEPRLRDFLSPAELARSEAFSLYLGSRADLDEDVSDYRREILGGLLPKESALRFLNSPATRILPRGEFEKTMVPYVDHEATVEHSPTHSSNGYTHHSARIQIKWAGSEASASRRLSLHVDGYTQVWKELPYSQSSIGVPEFRVVVWPRSVLDELRNLSFSISDRYPWIPSAATWFVLTGKPPLVQPITWTQTTKMGWPEPWDSDSQPTYQRETVTFTVEPWVSSQTIARFYRGLQKVHRGTDTRKQSERVLDLFVFVNDLKRKRGEGMTWDRILSAWNKRNPSRRYGSYSSLRSAYQRAFKLIAFDESRRNQGISKDITD